MLIAFDLAELEPELIRRGVAVSSALLLARVASASAIIIFFFFYLLFNARTPKPITRTNIFLSCRFDVVTTSQTRQDEGR